jgi:hypothetical protein
VKPATIAISVDADNAHVTVDGKVVQVKGRKAQAAVDTEGTHTIVITAARRDRFEKILDVKAGDRLVVDAKLERTRAGTRTNDTNKPGAGSGSATTKPPGPGDKNYTLDPFGN